MPRIVAFLIFDQFQILDAAGPIAAFEIAARHCELSAYEIRVIAARSGLVSSSSRAEMRADSFSSLHAIDTLIIVGGQGTPEAMKCPRTLAFIRNQAGRARRICSVCTGAYVLAATGLLDGRLATTHWEQSGHFARMYPEVRLEPDRIYTCDAGVWTSAGVTAGIDMALALIKEDMGEAAAKQVAQQLVVYYRRTGGQSQFSTLLEEASPESRFGSLLGWIREHIEESLSIERLAGQVNMSPRNFARAFARETGATPAKAVEKLRVEAASIHIQDGTMTIDQIAEATGFRDPDRMRRAFIRTYGQPPQAMRRVARSKGI